MAEDARRPGKGGIGWLRTQGKGQPNPFATGRPKGSKNRSTVVRQILEQMGTMHENVYNELTSVFKDIKQDITIEEIITYSQVYKAVVNGDTAAYKALMDSAYSTAANNKAEKEPDETSPKPDWLGAVAKDREIEEGYSDEL